MELKRLVFDGETTVVVVEGLVCGSYELPSFFVFVFVLVRGRVSCWRRRAGVRFDSMELKVYGRIWSLDG